MRLLLTSGGVSAPTIEAALVDLLGKPIAESSALVIPSAEWGHPACTPQSAWRFVTGQSPAPMADLGWASLGLLELTALPGMPTERWHPWVEEADALLVDGGDAHCLAHWMRESGLVDLMPSLSDTVWVGLSAGSMVMTPGIGSTFTTSWRPPEGEPSTLGVVDFSIFPHLAHPDMPGNTLERAQLWAEGIGRPSYLMDDRSAIRVVDGEVEVISEGVWHHFDG